MHVTGRVAITLAGLGGFLAVAMPAPSAAESASVAPDTGGWFWSLQVSGEAVPGSGVPFPAPLPISLSGATDVTNMIVGYTGVPYSKDPAREPGNDPDKESYVSFDVFSVVPVDGTISKFVVTLPVNPAERQFNFEAAKTSLIACQPDIGFAAGVEGEAFASKPKDDCAKAVPGVYDAGANAFKFDVTPFAQTWLTGDNNGIAIRNKLDQVQPFQFGFMPYSKALASVEFTAPEVDDQFVDEPFVDAPAPVEPEPFVPAPDTEQPVVPEPTAPDVPAPAPAVPSTPERAVTVSAGDDSVAPQFWFGLLLGIVLLGTTSLILGDRRVAVAMARNTSPMARRLSAPRRGATA